MKDGFLSTTDFAQTETCSDCIERGDVDLLGRVLRGREGRVSRCMGCGGSGRVLKTKTDIVAWWVSNRQRIS